jgi:hypothetical protein
MLALGNEGVQTVLLLFDWLLQGSLRGLALFALSKRLELHRFLRPCKFVWKKCTFKQFKLIPPLPPPLTTTFPAELSLSPLVSSESVSSESLSVPDESVSAAKKWEGI